MRSVTVLGIIPARYAATRLPGKPLIDLCGKPMIQRVWERAKAAKSLSEVLVATDDERIASVVRGFRGKAVMTDPALPSGTERVAAAAAGTKADVVVNIQGDEPLLPPEMIDEVVAPFLGDPLLLMATLRTRLQDEDQDKPQVVKVVSDQQGYALYFSRSLVPYPRNGRPEWWKHVGLYAFRADFLKQFAALAATPLEQAEGLEQLRVLEHGYRIKVETTTYDSTAVDTPEDAERVRRLIQQGSSK